MIEAPFGALPSSWSCRPLGEICTSVEDGDWIEKKDQGGSDYRLLQVSNVGVGSFRETGNFRYVTHETFDRLRCHEIQTDDILVARMPDPVGRAWHVTALSEPAITAVDVAIVTVDREVADPAFVAAYLNSPFNLALAEVQSSGTTRSRITRRELVEYPVPVPPLPTQERIAKALGWFRDLIDNSRRRIEILEEMAQLTYREWFVRFRFPGHENVEFVDSGIGPIPKSFEVLPIGDVVDTIGGGTPSKKESKYWEDPSIAWYTPSDLTKQSAMFTFGSGDQINELGLAKSSAKLFPARTVMMTSRATIGEIAIATTEASTNQGFISCVPNERLSEYHLYFWLHENVELFLTLASGATFRELRKSTFRELQIAVPPSNLETMFNEAVGPMCALVENLLRQIDALTEARDLLLPRLISGELDVSQLDIELDSVA